MNEDMLDENLEFDGDECLSLGPWRSSTFHDLMEVDDDPLD